MVNPISGISPIGGYPNNYNFIDKKSLLNTLVATMLNLESKKPGFLDDVALANAAYDDRHYKAAHLLHRFFGTRDNAIKEMLREYQSRRK